MWLTIVSIIILSHRCSQSQRQRYVAVFDFIFICCIGVIVIRSNWFFNNTARGLKSHGNSKQAGHIFATPATRTTWLACWGSRWYEYRAIALQQHSCSYAACIFAILLRYTVYVGYLGIRFSVGKYRYRSIISFVYRLSETAGLQFVALCLEVYFSAWYFLDTRRRPGCHNKRRQQCFEDQYVSSMTVFCVL